MQGSFPVKYPTPWIAWFILLLTFGYPKIPFVGIPIAFLIFIFDFKNLIRIFRVDIGIIHLLTSFAFILFCFFRIILGDGFHFEKNIIFCLTLCYKAIIGLYFSALIVYLFESKSSLLALYLLVQYLLILSSAFNEPIYNFLLLFQTSEATKVFGEIFGLRSVGFGVLHNEGVVALILLYVLYIEFASQSRCISYALGISGYLAAFSSRLVLLILPIWHIVKDIKLILIAGVFVVISANYLNILEGPLAQVFELYNYYIKTGSVGSQSTDVISKMNYMPDSITTLLVGDGQFFSDSGFYQDTDIGFSRMIYFGGFFGLLFYLMLCLWPIFIVYRYLGYVKILTLAYLIYAFIVSNIKGINIQSWAFVVYFILTRQMAVSDYDESDDVD